MTLNINDYYVPIEEILVNELGYTEEEAEVIVKDNDLTDLRQTERTPQEIKKHQENIMNKIKNIMVFSLLYSIIESSRGTKNKQTKRKR